MNFYFSDTFFGIYLPNYWRISRSNSVLSLIEVSMCKLKILKLVTIQIANRLENFLFWGLCHLFHIYEFPESTCFIFNRPILLISFIKTLLVMHMQNCKLPPYYICLGNETCIHWLEVTCYVCLLIYAYIIWIFKTHM